MRRLIWAALLILLLTSKAVAGLDDMIKSTALVTNNNSGTAFVFKEDKTHYWLLTAGHVVKKAATVELTFFHGNSPSDKMKAEVYRRVYKEETLEDLAVLKLDKKTYGVYEKPYILELGRLKKEKPTYFMGCLAGWPQGARGYIYTIWTDKEGREGRKLWPHGKPGQSGSAIAQETEGKTYCVGVYLMEGGIFLPEALIRKQLVRWEIDDGRQDY